MATKVTWLKIDGERVTRALEEAGEKLRGAPCEEVVLDFSAVRRVDSASLRALESLTDTVECKGNIALRGVNVGIYKVLKLTSLAPRFFFRT